MDLNALGEPDKIPWRMHGCFHNPPHIQVETMENLFHKHLPCMAPCIISNIIYPIPSQMSLGNIVRPATTAPTAQDVDGARKSLSRARIFIGNQLVDIASC